METRLSTRLRQAVCRLCLPLLLFFPSTALAADADFDRTVADLTVMMSTDPGGVLTTTRQVRARLPRGALIEGATLDWLAGEAMVRVARPTPGIALLTRARGIVEARRPGGTLNANILLSLGSALTDGGRIAEGLSTLQRAYALFLRTGDTRGRARALILIALLYENAGDNGNALRYFEQARAAHDEDPGLTVAIENGRGITLNEMGQHAVAAQAFERALAAAHRQNSLPSMAAILTNLGDAQLRAGDIAGAEASIAQGLALTRDPRAAPLVRNLIPIQAAIAQRRGEIERATALIDSRFHGVDLAHTNLNDRDAHEIAYGIYRARGNYELALAHLTAMKRLDDRATEIARSTGAALATARFDYANQELRIAKLKADDLTKTVAFERTAARSQKIMFVGATLVAAFVVCLLTAGLFTLRRSRNQVRAANAGLADSNRALGKALAARTEFLATTSHEIRTPLNGILGMTQVMIADPHLDAATRERLSVVHGAGVTMRALVDDILDVAKIESGKMTVERGSMDVRAIVADAACLWRDQAEAKGLTFTASADGMPHAVEGDPARVRQIVFNLLSNAVKFTARGDVALTATVATTDEGRRLRIAVADSGIGIPPEVQEAVFESFRQANAGTTRQFGGTGLGLTICRNLARAMGGDVTVRSAPGEGATFTLDLPLVVAAADGIDAGDAAPALLIVDRNPVNRAMYAALFADHGRVVFADDPAAALGWGEGPLPGRVLVDARAIPAGDDIGPLAAATTVAVLAEAGDMRRDAWIAAGVAQVIERPIARKELVRRIFTICPALVAERA